MAKERFRCLGVADFGNSRGRRVGRCGTMRCGSEFENIFLVLNLLVCVNGSDVVFYVGDGSS